MGEIKITKHKKQKKKHDRTNTDKYSLPRITQSQPSQSQCTTEVRVFKNSALFLVEFS